MKDFERIDQLQNKMDLLDKAIFKEAKRLGKRIEVTTNPIHKNIDLTIRESLYHILATMLNAEHLLKDGSES